ncbi:hypothetical protein E1288_46555, partial [Saccharopolyspora elongata]
MPVGDKPGSGVSGSDSGYGSEFGDTGSESGYVGSEFGDTGSESGYVGSEFGDTGSESGYVGSESGDTGSGFGDVDSGYGSDADSAPARSGISGNGSTRIGPLTTATAAVGVGVGGVLGQGGGPGATPGTAAGTPSPGMHLPTPGAVDPVTAGPTLIGVPSG